MSDDLLVPDPGIAHGRCVDVGPVGEAMTLAAPGPEENTFLDPNPYGPEISPAGDFANLRKIAAARRGVIRTIRNDRLESLEACRSIRIPRGEENPVVSWTKFLD